jgi:hypothetical protein
MVTSSTLVQGKELLHPRARVRETRYGLLGPGSTRDKPLTSFENLRLQSVALFC